MRGSLNSLIYAEAASMKSFSFCPKMYFFTLVFRLLLIFAVIGLQLMAVVAQDSSFSLTLGLSSYRPLGGGFISTYFD